MKAHGLTSVLFHKLSLESSGAGTDLAPDVRAAVDNVAGLQVVACVLNTIDDALDRSDPGIDWTSDAVAHLRPLMERPAVRVASWCSPPTTGMSWSDVKDGCEPAKAMSSNRSKPYDGTPIGDDEVRVRGYGCSTTMVTPCWRVGTAAVRPDEGGVSRRRRTG